MTRCREAWIGSVYLPSLLYHSYLVCVVLGMPFLLLDTFLNLSILFSVLVYKARVLCSLVVSASVNSEYGFF